jgi:hypothetical protein
MIECDDKDLKQYIQNLQNAHKYAFPDTVRATLTKAAYESSLLYKKNVQKDLTIRGGKTNIVLTSIHYEKAQYKEKDIERMASYVGQQAQTYGKTTEQLRKQELGETIHAKGKFTLKATKFTRGGSYKRFVQKENLISRTNAVHIEDIAHHPIKGNVKQQFKQAIAVAHTTHKTINFIPDAKTSGNKFGIFQFKDTGTKIGKDGKKHAKGKAAKLLYSFKDKNQNLKPKPMLKLAVEEIAPRMGEFFVNEAEKRLSKEMSKNLKN